MNADKIAQQLVGSDSMGPIMAILSAAKMRSKNESPEGRLERQRLYLEQKAEQLRKAKVISNECPTCAGKLVRGKKNKHNDYKRDWKCVKCGNVESL